MHHCSDSPAWKHFNNTHPTFASESRNVRLGLCTDGFQPFGQTGQQYSSWPVIVTPYNLPPSLCMKEEYMFLTIIVPGPKSPKDMLDVYLQPFIEEMKHLWEIGVETYDASLKNNFQMRAALMWTISDFPAYSILSGWSTAGRTACSYCKEDLDAFTLTKGGKQSWFDNHRKFLHPNHPFRRNKTAFLKNRIIRKQAPAILSGDEILQEIESLSLKRVIDFGAYETNRQIARNSGWRKQSIFWDLPCWRTNLIRHNLDVMHIEKNVFDNIFNTVMNVEGKSKDNTKSREDLKEFCCRPELERSEATGKYSKACYTLDKPSKTVLCEWLRNLKFLDGYVSNMGRCVDMQKLKLYGMKSHDCHHVFMQRLLQIAFRQLLLLSVWRALIEMSNFFRALTSTTIQEEDMLRLNDEILVIICILERIFPPSFFDSMEHLPVHLAYEAWIGDPVHYQWMYPFKRYLRKLKKNVRNKAKVEGSICNAYLVEEASAFCAHYFEPHVKTRHRKVPRNYESGQDPTEEAGSLSIFTCPGRPLGKAKTKYLTKEEYSAAQMYILLNCSEVQPFINIFVNELRSRNPDINDGCVDEILEREFAIWFFTFAHNPSNDISNQFLQDLSKGPLRSYKSYSGCIVNGFKFHTKNYSSDRATMNSGVCIKGTNYTTDENDFCGQLVEVLCLEYLGLPIKRTILFRCDWFDPTPNLGTKCHQEYKLVDVNQNRFFNKYEPFVLAIQATQVNYTTYPSLKRDKVDWLAVFKVKARYTVELPKQSCATTSTSMEAPFQQDENEFPSTQINYNDAESSLRDPTDEFF
ncbi:uncharacterized protein LOC120255075 [Dioscorea cayenensis subsp. rotundata]|uniref:Uncharacterized protein LOC120255075 n=1 Tax=Dioscorea cayennensis subsp. rotundata TaxID=55577 RepID=A0AB40AV28_DIOCR|nr:uncharacterized protein LOC120255075 [Dioscorea cayenensis subsp. rotundata]